MDIYDDVQLTSEKIAEFAEDAKDWAYTNGMVMKNNNQPNLVNFAPFMLFPSPFPGYLYKEASIVHKDFQTLAHLTSLDHDFIQDCLKSVIVHDHFTKKLYEIYEKVHQEQIRPKYYFDIVRSDYMIDEVKKDAQITGDNLKDDRPFEIKQIEVNMIAASFGSLGTKIGKLHRYMADILGDKCPYRKCQVAENTALENLGKGLAEIWKLYGNERAIAVFVVKEGETNRFDQKLLSFSFQESVKNLGIKNYVPVLYQSLKQIHENGELRPDGTLLVQGKEVAVCYFRAGYVPDDYPDEESWKGRLLIERSIVPKCPTVAEQLIGTKKVQQVLAKPGMVERFIKDKDAVRRIRRTFTGLYTLDPGPEGDRAAEMALKDPSKYVLKPQREGGGNNLYGDELVAELKRISDPVERSQYILMDLIRPPIVKNYVVNVNCELPMLADTVTELGIFGVFISDGKTEIFNNAVGHLLRTKDIAHNDGGVAAGRAVLDTPYLI